MLTKSDDKNMALQNSRLDIKYGHILVCSMKETKVWNDMSSKLPSFTHP